MIGYRCKQLYHALFPKIKKSEYIWIQEILCRKSLELFNAQHVVEQRHALDVAYDIKSQKQKIVQCFGKEAYSTLLLAALLHDCGKSIIKPRLWQRIFIVSTHYLPQVWIKKYFKRKNILGKTLVIYFQHPIWGKKLAAKAALNADVLSLIENHHKPKTHLEKILYFADNRH